MRHDVTSARAMPMDAIAGVVLLSPKCEYSTWYSSAALSLGELAVDAL
jgi:hypothetical protein